MKRLLMYSQDGMGLGHLRRSLNVAEEVLARNPKCNILILADSPSASLFGFQAGIDVVKLPTIVKTGSASWRASDWENGTLTTRVQRIISLRTRLIVDIFRGFSPDAVLIDHMPVGAMGELKPLLDQAATRRKPPKIFLGLRDILDDPAVIRQVWTYLDAYEYLRLYDSVLIYGDRDIYDATSAYKLTPDAGRVVYCNYVVSRSKIGSTQGPTQPFVLMMGGGGLDAFPLANTFMKSLPALNGRSGLRTIILTGPNMRASERETLAVEAGSRVEIRTALGNPERWIEHASAVVTLGGYNSLCEVLKWQRKALVVPRAGPSAEQRTRSQLFSQRGLIRMLDPELLTAKHVADALRHVLDDDRIPMAANIPSLDGAERSASILLDGLPHQAPESDVEIASVEADGRSSVGLVRQGA
jgi:predicted glycosyltransferase